MEKKYKLVLCDVDGTLLNSKKELTSGTKEAIAALKEQGLYFGIASGRGIGGLQKKVKEWDIENDVDVFVAMNGVQLVDCQTQKQYSYFTLKTAWIKEIMEQYKQFDANPCVYCGDTLLCERKDKLTLEAAFLTSLKLECILFDEFYQCEREKLLYIAEPNVINEIEKYYHIHHQSLEYRGVRTAPHMFEFINKKVSKSYGIKEYCKLKGFSIEEVVAFGDTSNDIEMLQDCGLGICMANGTEDAKQAADSIALSNDEEGVAKMIKGLFLFDKERIVKNAFRFMCSAENLRHAFTVYCTYLRSYQYTLKDDLIALFDKQINEEVNIFSSLIQNDYEIEKKKLFIFLSDIHQLAASMILKKDLTVEETVDKMLEAVPLELVDLKQKLHKKIAVSACLVGINCKYNGGNNFHPLFASSQEDKVLICPEMQGGLSCPRDPSEIKGDKIVSSKGNDVTFQFKQGAALALKRIQDNHCTLAILKAKSPSCGIHQIYDGTFSSSLIKGSGISAKLIQEAEIIAVDEEEYQWIMSCK